MNFEAKLHNKQYEDLWQEYCGFLDLDLENYMHIQNRLMMEQISVWSKSELGKRILKGKQPQTIEEFRRMLPLTTYVDYAQQLLQKRAELLPDTPVLWIETTWEGGKHPVKVAPYTKSMLDTYRSNVVAIFMLATSNGRGSFNIRPNDRMLYGLAPLPYATGLLPLLLDAEVKLQFLPPVKSAEKMSFGERNRKGFELGSQEGIDLFFGLSSVANFIGQSFSSMSSSGAKKNIMKYTPKMIMRYLAAKYRSKKNGIPIKPKDLFKLKGFVCAGTDSKFYKKSLEDLWGCRPLEIAAGTEPTCIATEAWDRDGLYFFPDACFYEFIPENEMLLNIEDHSYVPKTYLMDEVIANQNYEIVLTVLKGGAFARYRVGDIYRCLSTDKGNEEIKLPRFEFVDRVPTVIDIAGFTRITENSIKDVIQLSGLGIYDWIANKEYNDDNTPYLHLYVELNQTAIESSAVSKKILVEHLSVYFKYSDSDYHDLKRLLGIEPLEVTILTSGIFDLYKMHNKNPLRRMNPSKHEMMEFLKVQNKSFDKLSVVKK